MYVFAEGARVRDFVCAGHRKEIAETLMWPALWGMCPDCRRAYRALPAGAAVDLLPHAGGWKRALAVHEAGHAVTYLHLGVGVNYITVLEGKNGGQGGTTSIALPPDQLVPAGLWAGFAAERRLLLPGEPEEADLIDLASGSRHDALKLIAACSTFDEIVAARLRAAEIADRYADAIDRVAVALVEAGRLAGDQIADLAGITPVTTGRNQL